MRSEESKHQTTYFDVLRLNEKRLPQLRWIHASMNGASASSAAAAAQRKAQGQKKGVADVFIPVPMRGYHGFWIELKIKPNRLTPDQVQFLEDQQDMGYKTAVAWSVDEMIEMTEQYLRVKLTK